MIFPKVGDFVQYTHDGRRYAARVLGTQQGALSVELRIFPPEGSKAPNYKKLAPYAQYPKEKHYNPIPERFL